MITPTLERAQSAHGEAAGVVVWRDLPADLLTPLAAYWRLAHDEQHSFLLESVTGGEQLARYSFIGVGPCKVIESRGDTVTINGKLRKLEEGEDPLREVADALAQIRAANAADAPPFCGGAVGAIAYDYVRRIESLPDENPDDLGLPDVAMMVCESAVAFDHVRGVARMMCLTTADHEGYECAAKAIERIQERLAGPMPELPPQGKLLGESTANIEREEFMQIVSECRERIASGEGVQIVPSIRFSQPTVSHPLTVYRALRSLNPSPYMFLLRLGGWDVVGASPEALVRLSDGQATVRPIAGTRRRGEDEPADRALAGELLADEKERAEHVMLVDLARNDLGRVSEMGSIRVEELMEVERYSHVMHIVSRVTGALAQGKDAVDLIRSCFPAGTLSGAPKVRAMEIIEELEPSRRGLYGGAVGYLSAGGDVDLAIAIRTIVLKDGVANVQSGAGVVYDSVPAAEHAECLDKARAPLEALRIAAGG